MARGDGVRVLAARPGSSWCFNHDPDLRSTRSACGGIRHPPATPSQPVAPRSSPPYGPSGHTVALDIVDPGPRLPPALGFVLAALRQVHDDMRETVLMVDPLTGNPLNVPSLAAEDARAMVAALKAMADVLQKEAEGARKERALRLMENAARGDAPMPVPTKSLEEELEEDPGPQH